MDLDRLDHLARSLAAGGSRRRLLGALTAVPVLGGLAALLDPEEAEGKKRRRKRKDRHKKRKDKAKGKRRRKQNRRGCTPKKRAVVCAGRCGTVKNRDTCGKRIDCGSCDCNPPCGECLTCQGNGAAPGTCVPTTGTPCGPDQTCQDGVLQPRGTCDGSGSCQPAAPVSCTPYTQCDGAACASTCAGDGDCVDDWYCAGDTCVEVGANGTACETGNQCNSGNCVDAVCCATESCGICQACNLNGDGTCSTVLDGTTCGDGKVCCEATCADLQTDTAHCGACGNACAEGQDCQGGVCGVACGGDFCPAASEICVDEVCELCDVTCTSGTAADCGAALQGILGDENYATVYICPGAYRGGFEIARNVVLVGAGEGEDPASNTVLDGGTTQQVVEITAGDVTLRNLRVANGNAGSLVGGGIFLRSLASVTMYDCTVIKNTARSGGGILADGTLSMTRCTVRENDAVENGGAATGGGLAVGGDVTLTDCLIEANTSEGGGGGINFGGDTLTLAGATRIVRNTGAAGGGISIRSITANVTIGEDCQITDNTSTIDAGGGIRNLAITTVILQGDDVPSLIVQDNCPDNCAGPVPNCDPAVTCPAS